MPYFQGPYVSTAPTRCCCQPQTAPPVGRPLPPSITGSEGVEGNMVGSPYMNLAVQTAVADAFRQIAATRAAGPVPVVQG